MDDLKKALEEEVAHSKQLNEKRLAILDQLVSKSLEFDNLNEKYKQSNLRINELEKEKEKLNEKSMSLEKEVEKLKSKLQRYIHLASTQNNGKISSSSSSSHRGSSHSKNSGSSSNNNSTTTTTTSSSSSKSKTATTPNPSRKKFSNFKTKPNGCPILELAQAPPSSISTTNPILPVSTQNLSVRQLCLDNIYGTILPIFHQNLQMTQQHSLKIESEILHSKPTTEKAYKQRYLNFIRNLKRTEKTAFSRDEMNHLLQVDSLFPNLYQLLTQTPVKPQTQTSSSMKFVSEEDEQNDGVSEPENELTTTTTTTNNNDNSFSTNSNNKNNNNVLNDEGDDVFASFLESNENATSSSSTTTTTTTNTNQTSQQELYSMEMLDSLLSEMKSNNKNKRSLDDSSTTNQQNNSITKKPKLTNSSSNNNNHLTATQISNIEPMIHSIELLAQEGYPFKSPLTTIDKGDAETLEKQLQIESSIMHARHKCVRCKTNFQYQFKEDQEQILVDTHSIMPVEEENVCVFHWGRIVPFNFSASGLRGRKYDCCGVDVTDSSGEGGCVRANHHVYEIQTFQEMQKLGLAFREHNNETALLKTTTTTTTNSNSIIELIAIDCEMVFTVGGFEIGRVTMVDVSGKLIYDALVKPKYQVLDYNTRFSALTEANLIVGAHKTLRDVQNDFFSLISESTVLVGQSLGSDLKALRIIHTRILDSSILFPHSRDGFKRSLRELAKKYLGTFIQTNAEGHDSTEDARTSLELVKLKLKHGETYGVGVDPY